jgi:ArsR family metal-binding transcriptional regulator
MNTDINDVIQAIKVSIDATDPSETSLIAHLNTAIELLDESACGACGEWSRQFAHNCSEGF